MFDINYYKIIIIKVFRKRPMFNGREDVNILRSIVKLHGT